MNGYEQKQTENTAENIDLTAKKKPKKRRIKLKTWVYNFLFAIAGMVIGEVIAALTQNIPFLSWLSYKVDLGITTPLDINLIIARFQIGFYFVFNPALVIFIIVALAVGNIVIASRKD